MPGNIIGRVGIKVLPDTTGFRDDVADDLRKFEKSIGNLEVDVIPVLQEAAKKRVEAELKAWADGLDCGCLCFLFCLQFIGGFAALLGEQGESSRQQGHGNGHLQ